MPETDTQRPEELLGKTIAERYQLLEILGQGGIGVVYKAKHVLMNRLVAFKMLRSESLKDERNRKRFQQEAEAISRLNHPNIVSVFDFGFTPDNSAYMVMDFLDGKDLDTLIQEEGYLTPEEVAPIFIQICDAMTQSHQHGIIHRDLKPGNIIVVKEGKKSVAKLVDFGMAKFEAQKDRKAQSLTQPGEIFGSPYYMSPEQCIGSDLDARSDIYSMGVLMYEAVTGQPPFLANNMVEMAQMHIYEKPKEISKVIQDPDFPDWIQKIIFKALEKNVNDRYQTCEEMKQALMGFSKYWLEKTGGGETKPIEVRQRTTTKNLKAEIEAAKALLIAQGIPIPPVLQAAEKAAAEKAAAKGGVDPVQPSLPPPPVAPAGKVSASGQIAVPKKVVLAISVVIAILVLAVIIFVMQRGSSSTPAGWHQLEQTGRKALDAGQLSDAEGFFFKAMQAARADGDNDNPDLIRSMQRLATVYAREKKYDEAENVLKQTLAGVEQTESKNPEFRVSLLLQLGGLYRDMNRLDEAEKMHQLTMSIVEKTFGHDDIHMADVLNDYAATKEKSGKIAEAKALKKNAEEIRRGKKKSTGSEQV